MCARILWRSRCARSPSRDLAQSWSVGRPRKGCETAGAHDYPTDAVMDRGGVVTAGRLRGRNRLASHAGSALGALRLDAAKTDSSDATRAGRPPPVRATRRRRRTADVSNVRAPSACPASSAGCVDPSRRDTAAFGELTARTLRPPRQDPQLHDLEDSGVCGHEMGVNLLQAAMDVLRGGAADALVDQGPGHQYLGAVEARCEATFTPPAAGDATIAVSMPAPV